MRQTTLLRRGALSHLPLEENLANLFLVRISGFPSLFSAFAVLSHPDNPYPPPPQILGSEICPLHLEGGLSENTCFWKPLVLTQNSPDPSGPKPKRVRKGVPGPPVLGSSRISKECPMESEKSPRTQLRTLFGLFSDPGAHSLGTLGLPRAGGPGHPDSFRTFLGLRARRAPETSVPGRGVPNTCFTVLLNTHPPNLVCENGMQFFCLQLEASCLQWRNFTYS